MRTLVIQPKRPTTTNLDVKLLWKKKMPANNMLCYSEQLYSTGESHWILRHIFWVDISKKLWKLTDTSDSVKAETSTNTDWKYREMPTLELGPLTRV